MRIEKLNHTSLKFRTLLAQLEAEKDIFLCQDAQGKIFTSFLFFSSSPQLATAFNCDGGCVYVRHRTSLYPLEKLTEIYVVCNVFKPIWLNPKEAINTFKRKKK